MGRVKQVHLQWPYQYAARNNNIYTYIHIIIIMAMTIIAQYIIKENALRSEYVNVLQTTLAAEAGLAEGQFLHEEQTLNKSSSNWKANNSQNRKTECGTKVNLNKKESIIIQFLFICLLTQQPKGQLQSEHERKKQTHTSVQQSNL
jgi:hypothetical protein